MTRYAGIPLVLIALAGVSFSCASDSSKRAVGQSPAPPARGVAPVDSPSVADEKPRDYAGLHNVVAFHSGYYSGSVPEGAPGFDTLAGMGVKTIISVDGAEPDVAAAKARGIRYIHLPIGYNGFDEKRKLELVRATRDAMQEGPVYIHCHHGKHRSAGAAGTVAVSLGWATPEAAVARMEVSGTAPSYKGLYACTSSAAVLSAVMIDSVSPDFPEVSHPSSFVKGMLEIDEVNDHLKAIEKAGWAVPADHPDLVPVAEAGRLADLFRVLAAGDQARNKPTDFAAALRTDSARAQSLEDMLAAGVTGAKKLSDQLKLIGASCKDCHAKHRD